MIKECCFQGNGLRFPRILQGLGLSWLKGFIVMQVLRCVAAAQLPVTGPLRAAVQAVDRSGLQQSRSSEGGSSSPDRHVTLERTLTELGAVQAARTSGMAGGC